MRRIFTNGLAGLIAFATLATTPAFAQRDHREGPPPPYPYWEQRRDPPPGHEVRPPPPPDARWDNRRAPPPQWGDEQWRYRQNWLRRHGHRDDDHNAAFGLFAGAILGFVLGAAISDSRDRQEYAQSRLNDPAWIAYCARRYRSFDPYSGTYLGRDGLRHYCR